MLILCRQTNDRIVIGDNITITVTRISGKGDKVWLGIEAPIELPVHREEVAIHSADTSWTRTRRRVMSDTIRWRYGDTNPVVAAVDSASVIDTGDFVYQDSDSAKPASLQADQSSETANQELFADNFLGVAMQRSRLGDTNPIRVATTGVFEFACPSGTFELGDLIGVDEASDGTALEDQQVASVAASRYAVARVAKRVTVAATTVLVEICSKIMRGGVR